MYKAVQIFMFILVIFEQHHFVQCSGCLKASTLWECDGLSGHFLRAEESDNLDNMFILRIYKCNIESLGPEHFSLFPQLKTLSITDSVVSTQENLFEHLPTLEKLTINRCNVFESVAVLYANNTNLTHLQLSGNKISRVTKPLLQHLHRIEEIDLSYNQIEFVEEDVLSNITSLRKLDLSHNGIGRAFDPSVLIIKSTCLQCTMHYEDVSIKTIGTTLCHNTQMIDVLWKIFHSDEILHLNGNPVCETVFQSRVPVQETELQHIDHVKVFQKCPKHASRYLFLRESCNFGNNYSDSTLGRPVGSKASTSSSHVGKKETTDNGTTLNTEATSLPDNHDHTGDETNVNVSWITNIAFNAMLLGSMIILAAIFIAIVILKQKVPERNTEAMVYPLHHAVKENDLQMVSELLNQPNAKDMVQSRDSFGDTPLHLATNNIKIMELLFRNGADVNALNKDNKTAIVTAVWHANEKSVQWLIQHGAEINRKSKYNQSQIGNAAKDGHTDVVKVLLEKNIEIDQRDEYGLLPIHQAARNGHFRTVDLLLEKGSPVDCKDNRGNTPLHYASRKGHNKVVLRLLAKQRSIANITNNKGSTSLHKAAKGGHDKTVELLLDNDADLNAKNNNGDTPLEIASKTGQISTVALLRSKRNNAREGNKFEKITEELPLYQWLAHLNRFKLVAYKHFNNWTVPFTKLRIRLIRFLKFRR